jgi:hypothetical protein
MSSQRDPGQEERATRQAGNRFLRETDEMEKRSQKLRGDIEQARDEWARKRSDDSVPGANPPESEEDPPPEASFPAKEGDERASDQTRDKSP